MIINNINFKNFKLKNNLISLRKEFKFLLNECDKNKKNIIFSLSKKYQNNFNSKILKKFKKKRNFRIIGMGGSILGSEAIFNFLKKNIKKNFLFLNNLQDNIINKKDKTQVNIIISKSGNTLETICNSNFFLRNNQKNIIISELNDNYLNKLALDLKCEVIEHKNYIGGRYSVLSEVGMLPAELMGLDSRKFKQFNYLIKNKTFVTELLRNVQSIFLNLKKGKFLSVILNYDPLSEPFFRWYQQLVAESLGKKSKGIIPIISTMPKDNHSLMQYYLDGQPKCFYTFFFCQDQLSKKINNKKIIKPFEFLKGKNLNKILYSQNIATQKVFDCKNIPFRSFEIKKRNEKTIGTLFTFFILETILLGKLLKINPFDQPSVELIKKETKNILLNQRSKNNLR
tara:strand:+ start:1917 stop:3110 length:1194 start_codon:yes stop_codon:yes gene_type:complete